MNTEDTIYDSNEATMLDESAKTKEQPEVAPTKSGESASTGSQRGMWRKVAVNGGVGILFGAASSLFTSATIGGEEIVTPNSPDSSSSHGSSHSTSEISPIVDDQVSVATAVDDDMSFSQAFAAARAEVGPGGVFEWHGNLYGTYTAEEWDNMSAEERDDYNEHFAWTATESDSDNATAGVTDEVEVIGHETTQPADYYIQPEGEAQVYSDDTTDGYTAEADVQVLGVVHDTESGMNIASVQVDGQEAYLVDVDGGEGFEYLAVDANGDLQITEDEIVDISDQNLSVDDLGGFTDPDSNLYASNDNIDYTNNDMPYEG